MKITRYGISLERLQKKDIELVRHWRNDKKISRHMFYKGEITRQMQREWFASVDNEQNFFFLIQYKKSPIGLINISSIDWENKTAYSGLFIYDDKFLSTDVPVMSSLAMLDVFFVLFGMETIYAKVKGDNSVAHRYNTSLGFKRTKKIELGLGYEYILTKKSYLKCAKRLRDAAIRLKGYAMKIEWDRKNKTDNFVRNRLHKSKERNNEFLTL